MVVYFKCSFRSSHGFKMSMYNVKDKNLSFISEKSGASKNMIPDTIEYTLSNQLGHCMVLATDENGFYFFGIYRLIEGNDDKYVNAVFYDPDNMQAVMNLYDYFCNNQYSATQKILNCVMRTNTETNTTSNLEYTIESQTLQSIISNANMNSISNELKMCSPNSLLAFITTDTYNDYQIAINNKFDTKKMFLTEHYDTSQNNILNYQLAIKSVYKKELPVLLPVAIGSGIGIIGLIITLLILLL